MHNSYELSTNQHIPLVQNSSFPLYTLCFLYHPVYSITHFPTNKLGQSVGPATKLAYLSQNCIHCSTNLFYIVVVGLLLCCCFVSLPTPQRYYFLSSLTCLYALSNSFVLVCRWAKAVSLTVSCRVFRSRLLLFLALTDSIFPSIVGLFIVVIQSQWYVMVGLFVTVVIMC